MGVETVAIVNRTLPDTQVASAMDRFLQVAATELCEIQLWDLSKLLPFAAAERAKREITGFWCVGDDTVEEMLTREGVVGFELSNVHGYIGRHAAEMWTTMLESEFLYQLEPQLILRRLARRFALVMGGAEAIYVPDNGDRLSLARDLVNEGKSFEEVVSFAKLVGPPVPTPPLQGIDFSRQYRDVDPLYFIDDFDDSGIWSGVR